MFSLMPTVLPPLTLPHGKRGRVWWRRGKVLRESANDMFHKGFLSLSTIDTWGIDVSLLRRAVLGTVGSLAAPLASYPLDASKILPSLSL